MAHPDYIRLKAIDLRVSQQLTIDEIAECLNVSRTTAFYWVGDLAIPGTRKQSEARQRASDAPLPGVPRAGARSRRAAAAGGPGELIDSGRAELNTADNKEWG